MVRDRDIRQALLAQLDAEHRGDPDTLILDELGLCEGDARVDVAVVNGSLVGYEIKSERDTLVRLERQREAYDRVFDRVTLIVSPKHAEKVACLVPSWWGITRAVLRDRETVLEEYRPAELNRDVDSLAVAQLLWRDETLALLASRGLDRGLRSKPRRALWQALVAALAPDELADEVRRQLRIRRGWRADTRPSRGGG